MQEAHQSEEGAEGEGSAPHLGFLVHQGIGTEEEEDGTKPDEHDEYPRQCGLEQAHVGGTADQAGGSAS